MLLVVSAVNYADRATLSIAGGEVSKELGLESASRLYEFVGVGGRDDAMAMQYLIPWWRVDPKRPCLLR
jgi:hypothetical protein